MHPCTDPCTVRLARHKNALIDPTSTIPIGTTRYCCYQQKRKLPWTFVLVYNTMTQLRDQIENWLSMIKHDWWKSVQSIKTFFVFYFCKTELVVLDLLTWIRLSTLNRASVFPPSFIHFLISGQVHHEFKKMLYSLLSTYCREWKIPSQSKSKPHFLSHQVWTVWQCLQSHPIVN